MVFLADLVYVENQFMLLWPSMINESWCATDRSYEILQTSKMSVELTNNVEFEISGRQNCKDMA